MISELNQQSRAVKYEERNGWLEFAGQPTWYAWTPPENPGHVYFARHDEDVIARVREKAQTFSTGFCVCDVLEQIVIARSRGKVPVG